MRIVSNHADKASTIYTDGFKSYDSLVDYGYKNIIGYNMEKTNLQKDTIILRELKILGMRFGLEDGVMHTLEETGAEFGVTRERIRQIQAKAIEKLRRHTELKKVKDYY